MVKAFILIKIRAGDVRDAVDKIQDIPGVVEAYMTFGPYDSVVILESSGLREVGRIVAADIQTVPGVLETMTCLAVET
jgi:DNA-binding Lrp family transcriptional regulator